MSHFRLQRFEPLENRICLTVSASVVDGDLVVTGDADGAVEIVAVGEGTYQVSDAGVVVADATVLTDVTDDIRIRLESSSTGTDDTVSLDLGDQTVDRIYADLGDGNNLFEFVSGTAHSLTYRGGSGGDSVSLAGTINSRAMVSLGSGDNDLTLSGEAGSLSVRGGDGADFVSIATSGIVDDNVTAHLGNGDNSLDVAGSIGGNLRVSGWDGADIVSLAETAVIADSVYASLGLGDNLFTHSGTIQGDLTVGSLNANDTFTVSDTAVVNGTTSLTPGEQTSFGHCHEQGEHEGHEHGGHGHGGHGHGRHDSGGSTQSAAGTLRSVR